MRDNETLVQLYSKKKINKEVVRSAINFRSFYIDEEYAIRSYISRRLEDISNYKYIEVKSRIYDTPCILDISDHYIGKTISECKTEYILDDIITLRNFDPNIKYITLRIDKEEKIIPIDRVSYNRELNGYDIYLDKISSEETIALSDSLNELIDSYKEAVEKYHEKIKDCNTLIQTWTNSKIKYYQSLRWYNFIKKINFYLEGLNTSVGDVKFYVEMKKENLSDGKYLSYDIYKLD